jgi:hypothetical protein
MSFIHRGKFWQKTYIGNSTWSCPIALIAAILADHKLYVSCAVAFGGTCEECGYAKCEEKLKL